MKRTAILLPVLTLLWLAPACAEFSGQRSGNTLLSSNNDPVLLFSEADEIALGRQTVAAVAKQYKRLDNAAVQAYVNALGQRLAAASERAHLKYEFTVLDSPEINAFAAPGGFIYITTGILKSLKDEAELAAVLGHEVGHVVKQHSLKRMQRAAVAEFGLSLVAGLGGRTGALVETLGPIASNLVLLRNSREAELESDEQGLQLSQKVGLAPDGMVGVQQMLLAKGGGGQGPFAELFASHPPSQQRIQQAQALLPRYSGPSDRGAARYKAQVLDKLK
jgi:predicted Zn-dependent protease